MTAQEFVDHILVIIQDGCHQYEKSAPSVERYLDDLRQRINSGRNVDLRELRFAERLKEENIWMLPKQAVNQLNCLQLCLLV